MIGHAPSDVFEITVCVILRLGSCMLRKETPASHPSSITTSLDSSSQKPRPYRFDIRGSWLRARTSSATQSADTI